MDVSPDVTPPTLWNYAVCGQYPGAVPASATVTLQCTSNTHTHLYYLWNTCISSIVYLQCTSDMPAYRYLIVQFLTDEASNFCELEVYVRRKFIH